MLRILVMLFMGLPVLTSVAAVKRTEPFAYLLASLATAAQAFRLRRNVIAMIGWADQAG
jgi:hypothetical protein